MANIISCNNTKSSSIPVKGKVNFSVNACKIEKFISHTAFFMQRKGSFDHTSAVSEIFLRRCPLETSENALLANGTRFTLDVDFLSEKECFPHQSLFCYCKILEFALVNEVLLQKLERCAGIQKISLFYATIN